MHHILSEKNGRERERGKGGRGQRERRWMINREMGPETDRHTEPERGD